MKKSLEKAGLTIQSADVAQLPKAPTDVDVEAAQKVMRLIEALDDHDDVQNVYTSMNMTDEIMAALEKG